MAANLHLCIEEVDAGRPETILDTHFQGIYKVIRQDWASAAAACHQAGEDPLDDWDATIGDFEGAWS